MNQLLKHGFQLHTTQETQSFTQATQCPKHASNLTQAISCDKFQPCHWPLLAHIALIASIALKTCSHCTQCHMLTL